MSLIRPLVLAHSRALPEPYHLILNKEAVLSRKVYIGITADPFHHGHVNVIEKGREYGDVIVGLLTDRAVSKYKRLPRLNYEQRARILSNIKGVIEVIPQDDWDYTANLEKIRPDFMIHGDDWLEGPQAKYRDRALSTMEQWGGKIVEVPYTKGVDDTSFPAPVNENGVTPDIRLAGLRRLLSTGDVVRVLEVHSPLCGLIAETVEHQDADGIRRFDAMWSSSLTDSTVKGKPDTEALDMTARLGGAGEVFEVTSIPMIMDVDTGGKVEHISFLVRSMERTGISAAIIEDKTGLKKNSLLGNDVDQKQDSIEAFSEKIKTAKNAQITDHFMVIARIESLVLEAGMEDALERAKAYVSAGADGIMIHSREKEPHEIFEFCDSFRADYPDVPLVVVPTSYSATYERELGQHGVNVVIYANHMLRASYPGMVKAAKTILENGRAAEADEICMSIKEILTLVPGTA